MRRGSILVALILVIASESWSEERQSAKDFFPREGIVKTYRCTSGTGPIVRQTYRERDRFQGKDATALVEDLTTPDGKTEHSIYYYRVLDDNWSLLGGEKSSQHVTILYEPAITQFRTPLKAGDQWQERYTERVILPNGQERRVQCSTAFTVYGRETITISGKKYDCWKIASEIKRDGKRTTSAVSWIAKRYGTVRKTAWFPNGKVVEHEMETFRFGDAGRSARNPAGAHTLPRALDRE